jgi:hypothetical protein
MSDSNKIAPVGEQDICIKCGFCCDGTMFLRAFLSPGERGSLPEKIEQSSYADVDGEYFSLPCKYFDSRCTIYKSRKANVCGEFRCQLLKDFAAGIITPEEAVEIVEGAAFMRDKLIQDYMKLSGRDEKICFRKLFCELGHIQAMTPGDESVGSEYDRLLAGCNIFEALMIRHIRSKSDFDRMIGEEEYGTLKN